MKFATLLLISAASAVRITSKSAAREGPSDGPDGGPDGGPAEQIAEAFR
mgnify:CR=1 FL=1|jgi:hypothetical protein